MTKNVLFLCTGNSARSILAEALMNHLGAGRYRAYSAGSFPKGAVHPIALETLRAHGLPAGGFRSKSWDEFGEASAPRMDYIFTVCDNAAKETCPLWPGRPATAHWSLQDPAAVDGLEKQREAFETTYRDLERRIKEWISSRTS
jgi:arsenate reductase